MPITRRRDLLRLAMQGAAAFDELYRAMGEHSDLFRADETTPVVRTRQAIYDVAERFRRPEHED